MTPFYPLNKFCVLFVVVFALATLSVAGQTQPIDSTAKLEQPKSPTTANVTSQPAIHSVRDVELGMTTDEVRKKLGKPEVQDDTGMYFTLSGGDSVQIGLDENKHVRTVAAIYAAGSKGAPSLKDVFGPDIEQATGDTYKMERYPQAGCWISYSRTNSANKPVVIVTMRRIS